MRHPHAAVRFLGLVVLAGLVAPGALGPSPLRAGEPSEAPSGDHLVLEFDGPVPIESFLQKAAETLEIRLFWDPSSRGIRGKQIRGPLRLEGTREEILGNVRSLLTFYELVLIPVGSGSETRWLAADVRQTSAILKLKPVYVTLDDTNLESYAHQDGLFVTTVLRAPHLGNLRDARNALNRLVTGQNIGNVTEVPAAGAFVVTDFAPSVVAIYRLLKRMDEEAARKATAPDRFTFQAFPLKHASATEAARTLSVLFGSARVIRSGGAPPRAGPVASPPSGLRIQADARLNLLLATGPAEALDRLAAAVARLDAPAPRVETGVSYVRLARAQALEVAGVLTRLIQTSAGLGALPGTPYPTVVPYAEQNALLIRAPEAALRTLLRLLTEMDAAPGPAEDGGEGANAEEGK
ncbi:MAG: secretin N-terminal domain-containing protein [Planctomycetota bacterium]